MTATDELRRLLDERGVEWRKAPHYSGESQDNETIFEGNGIEWYTNDHMNGRLGLRALRYEVTPEQAVEATLGRGTCRIEKRHGRMSITDELREWYRDRLFMGNGWAEIDAIADRIDAEHEAKVSYWQGASYKDGYDEGFASADDWLGQHEDAMAEHGWVRLPKDADGEYIRIGDEMEGVDKYDSLKKVMGKVITVSFESDGIVDVAIRAWNSDGKSWRRAYLDPDASVYRHYHAPTVEDVLREFAYGLGVPVADSYIAASAAKLRLAGDAE